MGSRVEGLALAWQINCHAFAKSTRALYCSPKHKVSCFVIWHVSCKKISQRFAIRRRSWVPRQFRTFAPAGTGSLVCMSLLEPAKVSAREDIRTQRRKLPVYGVRKQLLLLVKSTDCLVLVAETGSGKTTQVISLNPCCSPGYLAS